MSPIVSARGYMKAAQFSTITKKITVNQVPIPECGENEILIKNTCASLCHSDLMHFWDNTVEPATTENVTIGHENTGVVVEVGKNTTGFKVGDKVGCLGCSYACSYHAVDQCDLEKGQWVAVVGCGGLGHLGIQYAKSMGFNVVAVDISDAQLENAKFLGADMTCNSLTEKDYVDQVKNQTKGGCHAAIVFSAALIAYHNAPKLLRVNGLMMIVGIPPQSISISALDILLGRYRIKGASSGTPRTMKTPIQFSHENNIKPHITTFNNLDDIHEVIRLMSEGKTAGRFGVVFN
ncbi:hypothetical protein B0O99DRAFT_748985 [Bisporella sp. PMI_857]|nr:hypothetical protein B0O99DRAFT_748985 [Bisporella sp. PMI_857]